MTTDPCLQKFREAYLTMATAANYRPRAAEDGFGNVLLSAAECTDEALLGAEATQYAVGFLNEENARCFRIGCSDFATADVFCWTLEAARQLATGGDGNATALKLLRLAGSRLEQIMAGGRRG
jgi:hypothetical protein